MAAETSLERASGTRECLHASFVRMQRTFRADYGSMRIIGVARKKDIRQRFSITTWYQRTFRMCDYGVSRMAGSLYDHRYPQYIVLSYSRTYPVLCLGQLQLFRGRSRVGARFFTGISFVWCGAIFLAPFLYHDRYFFLPPFFPSAERTEKNSIVADNRRPPFSGIACHREVCIHCYELESWVFFSIYTRFCCKYFCTLYLGLCL